MDTLIKIMGVILIIAVIIGKEYILHKEEKDENDDLS